MKIYQSLFVLISSVLFVTGCKKTSNTPSPSNNQQSSIETGIVTTFAGSGSNGSSDGTGTSASFNWPNGIAIDPVGNVYVADSDGLIRKITPGGMVTTLAGSMQTHVFACPAGVALDAAGNVYVADACTNLISKVTPAGVITTFAGSGNQDSINGTGTAASFNNPNGLVVDASGNVYVADTGNNLIRKITPGGVVTTFAGSGKFGSTNGVGCAASFYSPTGITIDISGNLYVTDWGKDLIRKITPSGSVTTFAGTGEGGVSDGIGTSASFFGPWGIGIDTFGNLYVTDSDVGLIRKITAMGIVSTVAGHPWGVVGHITANSSTNGIGVTATFNRPQGIAIDRSGNIYVADSYNNLIRKIIISD